MLVTQPALTLNDKLSRLKNFFYSGQTKSLSYRLKQLKGLQLFLKECESEIEAALYQDLRKPAVEAFATETGIVTTELNYTLKHLKSWIKPQRVSTKFAMLPGKSRIYAEPLGIVLIMAPWNYPIQLTLVPLVGALAAGNCVVIKPSDMTPVTSELLATKLPQYIDSAGLQIIEGGIPEAKELLARKFDHIFFTGSSAVGKSVLTAAAQHLTPVTLELGGKCPCIVDETADLEVAARRIVWAKFTNAGQSCVAPDYVLVHESVEHALVDKLRQAVVQFYGDTPETSLDMGRIINVQHVERLKKFLLIGDVVIGGTVNESARYIAPTILRNVPLQSTIMQEEIFGPILPLVRYNKINDAINYINVHPKPLAIYLFTASDTNKNKIITETSSGTMCINHAMVQLAIPGLPFGGVGDSGMGAYHGKASFDTFTHYKSVFSKPTWFDPRFFYPPYQEKLKKLLRWISG